MQLSPAYLGGVLRYNCWVMVWNRQQRSRRATGVMQSLRGDRRRPALLLALLCYLLVGGVVPQGHMATSLASGTAFHLCPGDLRSAQIIDALASLPTDGAGHHHHHHAHHGGDSHGAIDGSTGPHLEKSSADPGCSFAGSAAAPLASSSDPYAKVEFAQAADFPTYLAARPSSYWLRPPPRSPPV